MLASVYNHAPIKSPLFIKNSENFVVEEKQLYDWSNQGEWLILKIRKKDLTTHELLKIFSERIGVKTRDIGYAGLKDKHGMTIQNISIPKRFLSKIEKFKHPKIKILEKHIHSNKLKIGHLKGNRFFIRLKKVNPTDAKKINKVLKEIKKYGIPNYFGYQRFGRDNSALQGKQIIEGELVIRNRAVEKLLINAYQSELFNEWLTERINLSNIFNEFDEKELANKYPKELIKFVKSQKHPFKLLNGDVMCHYPFGKNFYFEDIDDSLRFYKKEIVPTGLLPGKKALRAKGLAREIEEKFDDIVPANGDRRSAWIFPEIEEKRYIREKAWYEVAFTLPKGSYATVMIEIIKNGISENLVTYKGGE